MRADILVQGIVQGVGFRPFIYRLAGQHQLVGYVRNRGDAGVEIVVEGPPGKISQFIRHLRVKNPPLSQIYNLSIQRGKDEGHFTEFSILESFQGGTLSGSVIPYDVATCDTCLEELRDPRNRRHDYFFITCTQCGPRFTTIEELPYDRPNTTMKTFTMCRECASEYDDPMNRRFHAQTVACATCGPHVFLTSAQGRQIPTKDPIRYVGELVQDGALVAIKGNGGFHVVASTIQLEPITRLRRVKHRRHKPFAIMAKNLAAIESFAEVSVAEAKLLTSSQRPIVLLKKRREFPLSPLISPGLHNVGVMLPYTGLHFMLFDSVSASAFIMTSANPPSEPIVIENQEAIQKLGGVVDYFLMHDRPIAQRCDDSVIRVNSGRPRVIRRSRGYAPAPILVPNDKGCSLGVGAKENANVCVVSGDKAFVSQYIGDLDRIETLAYHREATEHLINLTQSHIEGVGCDMHPGYNSRVLAEELGERFTCPVIPIQHHYAHMLALMVEWKLEELIGIVCDGAGYGSDGSIWGGEVLHCTLDGFERVGHLQEQPMVGGDLATRYPLRLAAGILYEEIDVQDWLLSQRHQFPHAETEINVILNQLKRKQAPLSSSCGRILDAVAAILGICTERTYEGEPAIKLESVARGGKEVLDVSPRIEGNVIDTSSIVREIFLHRSRFAATDLAYTLETYLAGSLASIAIDEAEQRGIKIIGFSGGAAYNNHIDRTIRECVTQQGLIVKMHETIPPGDGGIALGQAFGAIQTLR